MQPGDWITLVVAALAGGGLAGLVSAVNNALKTRSEAKIQERQAQIQEKQAQQEYDNLKDEMLLKVAKEYEALAVPLKARIGSLEEQQAKMREQHNEEIAEADREKRELQQVVEAQNHKIGHLETMLAQKERQYNRVREEMILLQQQHRSLKAELERLKKGERKL